MVDAPIALRVLPGLTAYETALALQKETVAERQQNRCADTLFLVEHPPVITLGISAKSGGVVAARDELTRLGISVHQTERGGQATYHGPGQIVGYPVVNLHDRRIGVAKYIFALEETMIQAARILNVDAMRREGLTGVFSSGGLHGKLGAIGVRVSRGVAFHGFAFNVAPDLTHYRLIVPCGLLDTPVVSIESLRGTAPSMDTAREAIVRAFAEVFGVAVVRSS